jgi:hypothetical protein
MLDCVATFRIKFGAPCSNSVVEEVSDRQSERTKDDDWRLNFTLPDFLPSSAPDDAIENLFEQEL